MRAIVQHGYGSPDVLSIDEIERPAVGDNEVLIRVRAASVNAMDAHMVHASAAFGAIMGLRTKRRVRGVDVAGEVEQVGKSVTRFRPRDEVFGFANGSFADYASTRQDRVALKPRTVSFQQAAAVPMAAITALQAWRAAGVQPGHHVIVHGAGGGVGTFAVQIAKSLGAHVTAVTGPRNVDVVRALGPDEIIDYSRDDFTTRGARYDVFFDNAATRALSDCERVFAPKGVLVAVGAPKSGLGAALRHVLTVLWRSRFAKHRTILLGAKARTDDLDTLRQMVDAGTIAPVIDRTFSLNDVPEAIRYVKAGQGRAKVVIDVAG